MFGTVIALNPPSKRANGEGVVQCGTEAQSLWCLLQGCNDVCVFGGLYRLVLTCAFNCHCSCTALDDCAVRGTMVGSTRPFLSENLVCG